MEGAPRAITWRAPEHHHIEKGGDWFVILAVVTVSVVIAAIFLDNILFALLVAIAGGTVSIAASREPREIDFAVTVRGVRVGSELFPLPSLAAYCIDEDDPRGPQLLVRSKRTFMPLLVLPVPEAYVDDVEDILRERLTEEHLEEPFLMKVLEFLGF